MQNKSVRIASYNIANGRCAYHDFQKIADDIVSKDIEIVGLQEVDIHCSRSKFSDTVKLLSEYCMMPYTAYFKCIELDGDAEVYGHNGKYGTAILSKYPILQSTETELNDGTLCERRVLGHTVIDVDGVEINFFNTHLSFGKADIRKLEFLKVSEVVNSFKNSILTGDFNVSGYDEFSSLEPLSFVNNPVTDIVTFPEGELRIDNICFSSEIRLVEDSFGTLDNEHSDHAMLYAELEICLDNR